MTVAHRRRGPRLRFSRDLVLFVFGLLGVGYETVISQTDRPTLLVLFGACLGLPVFLRRDETQTDKVAAAVKRDSDPAPEEKADPE